MWPVHVYGEDESFRWDYQWEIHEQGVRDSTGQTTGIRACNACLLGLCLS